MDTLVDRCAPRRRKQHEIRASLERAPLGAREGILNRTVHPLGNDGLHAGRVPGGRDATAVCDEVVAERGGREQRDDLVVDLLAERPHGHGGRGSEVALDSRLQVQRALGHQRAAVHSRGKRPLRRQPDAGVRRRQELLGARRQRAQRDQRVHACVGGGRQHEGDARAQQALALEVVVVGESGAVGHRDGARHREGIEAVHRAHVAAAVGDIAQGGEVAAVVPLRAVRDTDVVAMPRLRARHVVAEDDPRRDVTLRQRAANRPVRSIADRGSQQDVGDAAAGKRFGGEQIERRLERAGREQVDLAEERGLREEARGHVGRATRSIRGLAAIHISAVAPDTWYGGRVGHHHLIHRLVQDAAAGVPKAPFDLAVLWRVGVA